MSSLISSPHSRLQNWRRLDFVELEAEILQTQRTAVHRHLTPAEWRLLDRMRRRARELRKSAEAAAS